MVGVTVGVGVTEYELINRDVAAGIMDKFGVVVTGTRLQAGEINIIATLNRRNCQKSRVLLHKYRRTLSDFLSVTMDQYFYLG